MPCPGCNTRTTPGLRKCPNCGRSLAPPSISQNDAKAKLVRRKDTSSDVASPDVEIDLEEPAEAPAASSASASSSRSGSAGHTLTPDPAAIRRLLTEEPELLESKLSVLADKKGNPIGMDYTTDVGDIDLLARDAGGSLVVVMVAKGDAGSDMIGEILQRIGWVRKHLAKVKEGVRGVVLMESAPEDLAYTAAAVADTVSFKTYKMSLSFDDIET
jgi:RecB family endonuclease NucS